MARMASAVAWSAAHSLTTRLRALIGRGYVAATRMAASVRAVAAAAVIGLSGGAVRLARTGVARLQGGLAALRSVVAMTAKIPMPRLQPVLALTGATVAVLAIVLAGLVSWRHLPDAEQPGPQFRRPEIIALRDHHPPLPPQWRKIEHWALAGLPDIDGQGWHGAGFGAAAEEEFAPVPERRIAALPMPPGIPLQPEPPFGSGTPGGTGAATQPAWLANAALSRPGKGPMIAIVIDDAGVAQARTRRASELPAPLTISFIPYSDNLAQQTRYAHARGHELMLHIPMEPSDPSIDPGHNALLTSLGRAEVLRRVRWAFDRFDGYVGVNNHMGSKFMADAPLVRTVLGEIKARGLLFLDSRTSADSIGAGVALDMGMPHATRNVFLDHDMDPAKIREQLARLERVARSRGHAIAIGHPHDVTVEALAEWIPQARARGFQLVPVSAIVKKEYETQLASAR